MCRLEDSQREHDRALVDLATILAAHLSRGDALDRADVLDLLITLDGGRSTIPDEIFDRIEGAE